MGAGELPYESVPPRFMAPIDRVVSSPAARQVFSDFMREYAGAPHASMPHLDTPPTLERVTAGNGEVRFDDVLVSGYTELGSLVHVRVNWNHRDQLEKHLVVVGDMVTGELSERRVCQVADSGIHESLRRTLYLEGAEHSGWPMDYWPQVTIDHEGARYYRGGESREERVQAIGQLYTAAMGRVGLCAPRLRSV